MSDKLRMLEIEQQHLSIVSEFAVDMLPYTTVEEVVWDLVKNVVARLGFEDIVVYLLDEPRGMLRQLAAYGNKSPEDYAILNPIEIPIGRGVVGTVASTMKPLRIDDTRLFDGYIVDDEFRLSEMAVPMMAEGKLVGVIDSEHHLPGYFTAQHERTLVAIASIAATKIIKAQNHTRLKQTIEQLEYSNKVQDTLFEISELTFNAKALSGFYRGLQHSIGKLMFSDNFYVALVSKDRRAIRFAYNVDEFDNVPIDKSFMLDQKVPGITEYVLNTDAPLLLDYLDMIKMLGRGVFTIRGKVPKSWLAVPFGEVDSDCQESLRGVVSVQSYYDIDAFGEQEKQLLVFVAKHIRNAIERLNAAKALKLSHEHLQQSNSQLEEARREAEHASALKSTFVANISHEIRTPLTAIIGFTEQALKSQHDGQLQQEFLNRVLKGGRHLLELLNEILDLSKIEADKLELSHETLDVFELVDALEAVGNVLAQQKDLCFDVVYHYPLPQKIQGDIVRLKQVLLNICNNAVKFTLEGFVKLSICYENDTLLFAVQDSGIGMSKTEMQKLFRPFVQADANINRQFGGTGLGLVISKQLVTLMGGRITVQSHKDEGSCFTVSLPCQVSKEALVTQKPAYRPEKKQHLSHPHQLSARILVAEDNLDNQFLLKTLLGHLGVDVHMVENGQLALEAALFDDFDLILLDIQMPVMDGCEAVQLMRHGGIDCPIVALTANIMKQDIEKYLVSGFSDTLAKPIQLETFYQKLTWYLDKEKQTSERYMDIAANIAGSDELVKLKADFKAKLNQLSREFAKLAAEHNWQQLQSQAHQVKGSAGSLGFEQLTVTAADIELCLKQKCYEQAEVATRMFIEQCEQINSD